MNNKERMEELKSDILICILEDTKFSSFIDFDMQGIIIRYNDLNEKDKEIEDLLYFYNIKGTDNIDEDIEINDYRDIIPCIDIYKEKGIKGVNEYLRNISNSNTKIEDIEPQTVITDNQEQTTNTNTNNIGLNKNLNTIFSKINSNTPLDEKDNEFLKKLELSEIPDTEIFEQVTKSVLADTKDFLELTDSEIINFVNNDTIAYNIVVTLLKLLGSKSFISTLLNKDDLLNGIDKNRLNDKDYLLELFDNLPMNIQDVVYKIIVRIANIETFGTDDNMRNTINVARQLKAALTPKEQETDTNTKEPETVIDTKEPETDNTKEQETDNTKEPETDNTKEQETDNTKEPETDNTKEQETINTNNETNNTIIIEPETVTNTKEQETSKVETNNTIIEEPETTTNTNTKTEDVKQETNTKQHKAKEQEFTNAIIDCIKGHENFPFVETGYFSADGIEYKNLITKEVVTYTKEEFANFKIQYLNDPLIQFRNAINDNLKSLNPCDYLMMKGYQITLNNPRTFIIDRYLYCVNILNNSSFCLYKDMMNIILNNGNTTIYIIYFDKCSVNDLYNLVEQYWNTGTIEPRLFAKLIKSKALVPYNTTTK